MNAMVAGLAGTIGIVAILILAATPVRGAVYLNSTNWTSSCNPQKSGNAVWINQGNTRFSFTGPNDVTGATALTGSAKASAGASSLLWLGQHFDLSQRNSGCYHPATNRTINVTYSWLLQGDGWLYLNCTTGSHGPLSANITVFLLADMHFDNVSPYYMTLPFPQTTIAALTTAVGTSCPGAGLAVHVTNTIPRVYNVTGSGTVTSNRAYAYDFFTAVDVIVGANALGTTPSASAAVTYSQTATLQSISCPRC